MNTAFRKRFMAGPKAARSCFAVGPAGLGEAIDGSQAARERRTTAIVNGRGQAMSNETSPGPKFDPALVPLDNYLVQREALRRAAEGRASGSPSALEAMLAQIPTTPHWRLPSGRARRERGRRRWSAMRWASNKTDGGCGETRGIGAIRMGTTS